MKGLLLKRLPTPVLIPFLLLFLIPSYSLLDTLLLRTVAIRSSLTPSYARVPDTRVSEVILLGTE